jgi:hypothetical protein
MGGDWKEVIKYDHEVFDRRPTINQWMSDHAHAGLNLVFSDDGGESSHVFAALNGDIVDCYTNGRRINFNGVPDEYRAFRVKRTFLVF